MSDERCAACGAPFAPKARRDRPQRYCSRACAAAGRRRAPECGTRAAYDKGCRCEACRTSNSERNKRDSGRRRRRLAADPDSLEHGSARTYGTWKCRCEPCRTAWATYVDGWRSRGPAAEVQHGTVNGYANHRCRCDECRAAATAAGSARRSRLRRELIPGADKFGNQWTGAELEIVVTRTDLTSAELARMLGRTPAAIVSARQRATRDPKWIQVAGKP